MSTPRLAQNFLFCILFLCAAAAFSYLLNPQTLKLPAAYAAAAGGGDSHIIALNLDPNRIVIVDGQNKKILYYEVKSRGLALKEVRNFEKTLEIGSNQYFAKGLTGSDEKKALDKYLK